MSAVATEAPAVREAKGRRRSIGGRVREYAPAVVLVVLFFAAWEVLVRVVGFQDYLLPAPDQVATALWENRETLLSAAWLTAQEMVLGFAAAAAVGIALAILIYVSPLARRAVYPLLIVSQNIPMIVIAPVLAILLGYNIGPKIIVVGLVCFFSVVVNTYDGLRSVDRELIRLMRTLDGSRWATFRRIEFPAALPSLFTGLRIAATYAAIGAVFGEWAGSQNGLGFVMLQATPALNTGLLFAAIVVLAVMALAMFGLVSLAERKLVPWARTEKGRV